MLCSSLGREKLGHIEDIATFGDSMSLLQRMLRGRSSTPRLIQLVHQIWEEASSGTVGLTFDLERVICEQLHENASIRLRNDILLQFPDLSVLQGDFFWSCVGDCGCRKIIWQWATALVKLARAASHLHFTSSFSTRSFALTAAIQARSGHNVWLVLPSSLFLAQSGLAAEAEAGRLFLEALQAAAIANIFLMAASPPGDRPQPIYRLLASAFVAKCRGIQDPFARLLF
jgi:hypothetical protein